MDSTLLNVNESCTLRIFHGIRPNLSSLTLLLVLIQIFDLLVTLSIFNECKFQEIEDWILS